MIDLLKCFPFIFLVVTHPLEQMSIINYHTPNTSVHFLNESNYIAPDNGFIKSIVENEGAFQVILSLDSENEVVYSGLTEVIKKPGERVTKDELIGVDATITPETKFILMFYEYCDLFPQFIGNDLIFLIKQSSRVYMVANGIIVAQGYVNPNLETDGFYTQYEGEMVIPQSFISRDVGNYSQVKLAGTNTFISYWHLSSFLKMVNSFLHQGDLVATSGNTGFSLSPRLVMHIEDREIGNDVRVIYFRGIRK